MVAADSTQLWRIDLTKVDVVARNLFRKTVLFRSYNEHNFLILLNGAKASLVAKRKLPQPATGGHVFEFQDILTQALEIIPLCDTLKDQAEMALRFLDPQGDRTQLL